MQHDLYRFRPVGARSDEVKLVKRLMNAQSVDSRPLLAVEGLWAYERILKNPGCLKVFLFDPESVSNEHEAQIVELLASASERTYTISGRVSRMLTNRDNPTGYFCVCELPPVDLREVDPGDSSLVVVLDQLDSPGNIGTILRVAEGAGCDLVISCDSKVSRLHPKLAKASMGAVFTVPTVECSSSEAIAWLKEHGYRVVISDPHADSYYYQIDYTGNVAVVLGNEHRGLSDAWRNHGFTMISIPMHGKCDSLNVAIAAAVVIYEASLHRSSDAFRRLRSCLCQQNHEL